MTISRKFDDCYKLLLVGDSGVGKSALTCRYVDQLFHTSFVPTIGIDFKVKYLTVDGKIIKLHIWDTAGQERFRTITPSYYRGAHGILLVYDATNRASFEHVQHWLRSIRESAPDTVVTVLVANKSDLTDQCVVPSQEAEQVANKFGIRFVETSAKENVNVDRAFGELVVDITAMRGVVRASDGAAPTVRFTTASAINPRPVAKRCC